MAAEHTRVGVGRLMEHLMATGVYPLRRHSSMHATRQALGTLTVFWREVPQKAVFKKTESIGYMRLVVSGSAWETVAARRSLPET